MLREQKLKPKIRVLSRFRKLNMKRKKGSDRSPKRFLGTYTLPDGTRAVGELRLKGANTLLKVHSDSYLPDLEDHACINGLAYTSESLTLIDCRSPGTGSRFANGVVTNYHAEIFAHYVAIGGQHFDPNQACIRAIHFETDDLADLFYDYDAFSVLLNSKPLIERVLQERREMRPVESGDAPLIGYFSGKERVLRTRTALGTIGVHHRPSHNLGGPSGVTIKNQIVVSVEPDEPFTFDEAMQRERDVTGFLSLIAGRTQGVRRIQLEITPSNQDMPPTFLVVVPSYREKRSVSIEQHKPHPADVPLNAIDRPEEFNAVLVEWCRRHTEWKYSRWRYLDCLRKGNRYDANRLVAAANMFDILPASAVPLAEELAPALAATRDASVEAFRKHPVSIDRDSALSALGRLGKPSLPKKVAHRAAIVDSELGSSYPDLALVASVAVKCRNFLVHGSSGDIDFEAVEPFQSFLCDTLEFVFAASDLIESGWDARRWHSGAGGWGHSFARFRSQYRGALTALRNALGVSA